MNGSGQPIAFRDEHCAPAGFVAGLDGLSNRLGALVLLLILPLALNGSVVTDIERPVGEHWPLQLRHLKRRFDRGNLRGRYGGVS